MIAGAVGLGAAINYLNGVGLPAIAAYEHALLDYAEHALTSIRGVRLIGTAREKASVMSFTLKGHDDADVAKHLDARGVAVRAGHHCALPALRRFGASASSSRSGPRSPSTIQERTWTCSSAPSMGSQKGRDVMTVQTLSPLAVRERHVRDPRAVLLDVRSPAEFASVHIVGSRNVALAALDPAALAAGDVAYETPITAVCQSGARARAAAERLAAAGFSDVAVLERGLQGWGAAGLPVARAEGGAISLERQVRITAGSLVVLGVVLAATVSPYAILLSAFIGAGLVFSGVTDTCGMGLLLARAPWNTRGGAATSAERPDVGADPVQR